jgi:hypothetical protein
MEFLFCVAQRISATISHLPSEPDLAAGVAEPSLETFFLGFF